MARSRISRRPIARAWGPALCAAAALALGSSAWAGPAEICARSKIKAAGNAARNVLRAYGDHVRSPNATKLGEALADAEQRLAKDFAKADSRGTCPTPAGANEMWQSIASFGNLVVTTLTLEGVEGTWTLTGSQTEGECQGGVPVFASTLTIVQNGSMLIATEPGGASFSGSVTATDFFLGFWQGAVTCGASGGYDVNRSIFGVLPAQNGQITVTQHYSHAPVAGSCPPCNVTWTGTMTRSVLP